MLKTASTAFNVWARRSRTFPLNTCFGWLPLKYTLLLFLLVFHLDHSQNCLFQPGNLFALLTICSHFCPWQLMSLLSRRGKAASGLSAVFAPLIARSKKLLGWIFQPWEGFCMEKEPSAPAVKSYCVKSCSLAAAALVAGVCSLLPASSLKKTARCHPYNHRAGVCIYSEMPVRPQKRHFAIQNVLRLSTLDWAPGRKTHSSDFKLP